MNRFFLLLVFVLLTPLIVCAEQEDINNALILEAMAGNAEMMQYWLVEGANPNAKLQSGMQAGRSILFETARAGHIECVKILLSAGADINTKDPYYGDSPLDVAIRHGHTEVAQILKEAGAKE